MFRKFTSLFTALILLMTFSAAFAESYTAPDVGTWTFPGDFTIDSTTYTEENTDTETWLFLAENDSILYDFSMVVEPDLAGESMFNYSEDDMKELIAGTEEAYSNDGATCTWIETITAGAIPFALYAMQGGEEGDYYWAETIANGNSIIIMAYYTDESNLALPADHLDELRSIVASFAPAL